MHSLINMHSLIKACIHLSRYSGAGTRGNGVPHLFNVLL